MKKVSFICGLVIFLSCTPQINVKEKESVLLGELDKSYSAGKWEQALLYIDSLKDYGVSLLPIEAECYAGIGEYDKAIGMLENEIKLDTIEKIYYCYQTLGQIYHLKKDYDNAVINYKKVIELRPTYARPYVNLGELYSSQGDKQQSVDYFILAIRLFVANEFYAEVIEFSGKVLSIDPVNTEAYKYLQYALYELQQYDDALSVGLEFDSILESGKQWDERHENWLFTGMAAYRCKDYQLSYDLIGNSMQFDDVKTEYGWWGFSYLSAICTKQGKEELAKEYADVAKIIGEKSPDEFIKELLNE